MSTARNLERETQAVQFLREQLRAKVNPEDAEFFHDLIEGQTNLFETLNAAAEQLIADEGMINGIESVIRTLKSRSDRIARRIDHLREAIRVAMERAEIKSHQAPSGTMTRMLTPLKTIITDEAAIPAQFWRQPPPVIDKKSLLAALKDGEAVEGAELSNRSETLQFRSG